VGDWRVAQRASGRNFGFVGTCIVRQPACHGFTAFGPDWRRLKQNQETVGEMLWVWLFAGPTILNCLKP
jgi:hypothetical protein